MGFFLLSFRVRSAATLLCGGLPSGNRKPKRKLHTFSVISTETNEVSEAEKSQIIFLNVIDAIALDSEQSLFRRLRLLTTKGAARVEKSQKNESTDKRFLRSLRSVEMTIGGRQPLSLRLPEKVFRKAVSQIDALLLYHNKAVDRSSAAVL